MRFAALTGLALLATPSLSAQVRLCRADPVIGGDLDDRARLATLLGGERADELLLRSLSSREAPLDSAPLPDRLRWCAMRPEVTGVYNSAIPFSLNYGPLWAGRGWSEDIRGGLRAQWRRGSPGVSARAGSARKPPVARPPFSRPLPPPPRR